MAEYLIQGTTLTAIGNSIRAKEGTSATIPVSEIASRIAAIETGVTVKRKSGTFTINSSGNATVNCGFKPDFVYLQCHIEDGNVYSTSMPFAEELRSGTLCTAIWSDDSSSYTLYDFDWMRSDSGFSISARKWDYGWEESPLANKKYSYVAVKYT